MPQTSVRIGVLNLHLVLLARFLYDMTFFAEELWAMSEGLRETLREEERSPDAGPKEDACQRTTLEVL